MFEVSYLSISFSALTTLSWFPEILAKPEAFFTRIRVNLLNTFELRPERILLRQAWVANYEKESPPRIRGSDPETALNRGYLGNGRNAPRQAKAFFAHIWAWVADFENRCSSAQSLLLLQGSSDFSKYPIPRSNRQWRVERNSGSMIRIFLLNIMNGILDHSLAKINVHPTTWFWRASYKLIWCAFNNLILILTIGIIRYTVILLNLIISSDHNCHLFKVGSILSLINSYLDLMYANQSA